MTEAVVHIIDDDEAVRQSIGFLLEMSGLPVSTYEGPSAFLSAASAGLAEGCIVTDVRMPEMNGLEMMRRARGMGVHMPVIVMTGHGDVPLAVEAMKSGACDFLEKPFSDDDMLEAVKSALAPKSGDAELRGRLDQLSARERQVLDGLIAGHPNKVIARDLGISDRTVEIYRAKVMSKMGAENFAELIRLALRAGVPVEEDDHTSS